MNWACRLEPFNANSSSLSERLLRGGWPTHESTKPSAFWKHRNTPSSEWLQAKAQLQDARFIEAVGIIRKFLDQAIIKKIGQILAMDTVRQAPRLLNGRVLHLREGGMPWTRVVVDEMPEVRLVIYPDSDGSQFQLKTVPVEVGSFDSRMDLPSAWAGLRDAELAAVTGVADSVFCHLNLFIAGARSFEGAVRLAELALSVADAAEG